MSQADDIVRVARTWVGTRYHHQGRLKADLPRHRGGVDCLGVLAGVAGELGLVDGEGRPLAASDRTDYPLCLDRQPLRARLGQLLHEKETGQIGQGDILLFTLDKAPQHLAIAARGTGEGPEWHMIHAYAPAKGVVEHRLDEAWKARLVALFTLI